MHHHLIPGHRTGPIKVFSGPAAVTDSRARLQYEWAALALSTCISDQVTKVRSLDALVYSFLAAGSSVHSAV